MQYSLTAPVGPAGERPRSLGELLTSEFEPTPTLNHHSNPKHLTLARQELTLNVLTASVRAMWHSSILPEMSSRLRYRLRKGRSACFRITCSIILNALRRYYVTDSGKRVCNSLPYEFRHGRIE